MYIKFRLTRTIVELSPPPPSASALWACFQLPFHLKYVTNIMMFTFCTLINYTYSFFVNTISQNSTIAFVDNYLLFN